MSTYEKELTNTFKHLLKEQRTNQAILFDAPWGTGKTHFLKGHLIPALKNAADKEGANYKHILYISLFGMSATSEITDAIYSSYLAHYVQSFVEKKTVPMLSRFSKEPLAPPRSINYTKYLSIGAKLTTTYAKYKKIDTDKLPSIKELFEPHSTVIIFDDLERCPIPTTEVYGYINNLVEHSGTKVILTACVDKIGDKDIKEQHEKLIGVTLKYQPNYVEVYKSIVNSPYVSVDFLKTLLLEPQLITWSVNVLIAFQHINMRTFIHALINFDQVYHKIQAMPHPDDDVWKSLLIEIYQYTLVCAIRIRSGNELDPWKDSYSSPKTIKFSSPESAVSITGFHFINTLLTEHTIDEEELEKTINSRQNSLTEQKQFIESKENQVFNKIRGDAYLDYSMPELMSLARQIPDDIAKEYYSDMGFREILIFLLKLKHTYPDYKAQFDQILADSQTNMLAYIDSHERIASHNAFIYQESSEEYETEYNRLIQPILELASQKGASVQVDLSKNIKLWGEALYNDYMSKDMRYQSPLFTDLNLDWAIEKIKESSTDIKSLRYFTKSIHYYYITENVHISADVSEIILRFCLMVESLDVQDKDTNYQKAIQELIDLLQHLIKKSQKERE